jgi:hypothetical protein
MQRAVNTALEEEVFSVLFVYIHCWTTDVVLSMGLSPDCISSRLVSQMSVVERGREWSESSAVKEEGFG